MKTTYVFRAPRKHIFGHFYLAVPGVPLCYTPNGGSLENRSRFLLDIVKAIRSEFGYAFHLQMKINGTDYNQALLPWERKGNTIEDSIQVCKWLEAAGVDSIHVSTGEGFVAGDRRCERPL